MMEGYNTGLETNNILLDIHFPGSTPMGTVLQATSNQVDMVESSPEPDEDHVQDTCPVQVTEGEVLNHQYHSMLSGI